MEFPADINWTSSFPMLGLFVWYFSFLLKILKKLLFANSGEPDQTPHYVASDLVLHCLLMSHKKDARLIWVKVGWSIILF